MNKQGGEPLQAFGAFGCFIRLLSGLCNFRLTGKIGNCHVSLPFSHGVSWWTADRQVVGSHPGFSGHDWYTLQGYAGTVARTRGQAEWQQQQTHVPELWSLSLRLHSRRKPDETTIAVE